MISTEWDSARIRIRSFRDETIRFLRRAPEVTPTDGNYRFTDLETVSEVHDFGDYLQRIATIADLGYHSEAFALIRGSLEWAVLGYSLHASEKSISFFLSAEQITEEQKLKEHIVRHHCRQGRGNEKCYANLGKTPKGSQDSSHEIYLRHLEQRVGQHTHRVAKGSSRSKWDFLDEDNFNLEQEYIFDHYFAFNGCLDQLRLQDLLGNVDENKIRSHYNFLSSYIHGRRFVSGTGNELRFSKEQREWFLDRTVDLYLMSVIGLFMQSLEVKALSNLGWNLNTQAEFTKMLERSRHAARELGFPFMPDHPFDEFDKEQMSLVTKKFGWDIGKDSTYVYYDYLNRIQELNFPSHEMSYSDIWKPSLRVGFDL